PYVETVRVMVAGAGSRCRRRPDGYRLPLPETPRISRIGTGMQEQADRQHRAASSRRMRIRASSAVPAGIYNANVPETPKFDEQGLSRLAMSDFVFDNLHALL